jgi:NAD(P)-dependent dehydrogenase (short-subunit alcohol dehydrogenase family)
MMTSNSPFSLKGKIVVVTGALGLIGQQHCRALNEAGACVVATDLDEEGCIEFAQKNLTESMGHYLDVTKKISIRQLLENVLSKYRRIDVLVNNAAINDMFEDPKVALEQSKFENYPLELWQKSIEVNLTGVFLCSQVIGKHMADQGEGNIINIGSTYGVSAPNQDLYKDSQGMQTFYKPPAYPVTKAGVIMLTKYLAAYWGQSGIRVNTLTPGGVRNGQNEFFIGNYSKRTPLGRMAESVDYRGALVFLASDASLYMTGANLVVDGGWTCW